MAGAILSAVQKYIYQHRWRMGDMLIYDNAQLPINGTRMKASDS